MRQRLAVRRHNEIEGNLMQLLLLRSNDCPHLKDWMKEKNYLSSDILNGLMSNSVLRDILCKIREACKFSLIADEATDVSNTEQLCITIRWVDNEFDIHEDPLELIQNCYSCYIN